MQKDIVGDRLQLVIFSPKRNWDGKRDWAPLSRWISGASSFRGLDSAIEVLNRLFLPYAHPNKISKDCCSSSKSSFAIPPAPMLADPMGSGDENPLQDPRLQLEQRTALCSTLGRFQVGILAAGDFFPLAQVNSKKKIWSIWLLTFVVVPFFCSYLDVFFVLKLWLKKCCDWLAALWCAFCRC